MYCSYCGKPNSDDFRFCSYCGKAHAVSSSQSFEQTTNHISLDERLYLDIGGFSFCPPTDYDVNYVNFENNTEQGVLLRDEQQIIKIMFGGDTSEGCCESVEERLGRWLQVSELIIESTLNHADPCSITVDGYSGIAIDFKSENGISGQLIFVSVNENQCLEGLYYANSKDLRKLSPKGQVIFDTVISTIKFTARKQKTREQAEKELGEFADGMFSNAMKKTLDSMREKTISKEFVQQLQSDLANTLREALEQKRLSVNETNDALDFIKENLSKSNDVLSLKLFLIKLSGQWNIFNDVCNAYQSKL
jgi:hypothetical protein